MELRFCLTNLACLTRTVAICSGKALQPASADHAGLRVQAVQQLSTRETDDTHTCPFSEFQQKSAHAARTAGPRLDRYQVGVNEVWNCSVE